MLRREGHIVQIIFSDGVEMKAIRIKTSRFIRNQEMRSMRGGDLTTFQETAIDVSHIRDDGRYYSGFLFVPSMSRSVGEMGRDTCAAEAAHCDGVERQSYGTTFEVLGYDANNHLCPIVFPHFLGAESMDTWGEVFKACYLINGFDTSRRTTIVDQENGTDRAYRKYMSKAKLFLDPLHVKKICCRIWRLVKGRGSGCMKRPSGLPQQQKWIQSNNNSLPHKRYTSSSSKMKNCIGRPRHYVTVSSHQKGRGVKWR